MRASSRWRYIAEIAAGNRLAAGWHSASVRVGTHSALGLAPTTAFQNKHQPAIILTHSQSGPFGWLIADTRPKLVKAVVAFEPAGPPFQNTVFGTEKARAWGIADIPITYDPPVNDPVGGTRVVEAVDGVSFMSPPADDLDSGQRTTLKFRTRLSAGGRRIRSWCANGTPAGMAPGGHRDRRSEL